MEVEKKVEAGKIIDEEDNCKNYKLWEFKDDFEEWLKEKNEIEDSL